MIREMVVESYVLGVLNVWQEKRKYLSIGSARSQNFPKKYGDD